jgi:hypothetical protein
MLPLCCNYNGSPWARTGSLFTRVFEKEVAWFIQKTNQAATAAYFGISWPTAGKIAHRVVAEKLDGSLLENLRFLGIDEIRQATKIPDCCS